MCANKNEVGSSRLRGRVCLVLILLLAAGLRMWGLDKNGYGNLYQAATVRSMLLNWHNYFYGSFDPAGFLSVDKPPVAFWIEAACAKLLGFSGFSMFLPQALEGVAAVALIYHLVRGRFGGEAALLASLALAIMPVSVAVDRSNYADSCLVLELMMASWAVCLATERGSLVLLLTSAALLGVAFNTKMLVAFGVLPTFFLVYLLGTPLARRSRLMHLVGAFAVLGVVSASWGLVVDLTPPDRRPYVASSRNNSVLGLALGYNGFERVLGLSGASQPSSIAKYIPGDGREGMPGFGGMPGPLRLANRELAGQITWLIPLAIIGSIVAAARDRSRSPLEPRHVAILLWGGWLGSYAVVFSGSRGIIHPYYLGVIAPPVAALFGIGVSSLREDFGRVDGGPAALLTALILTAVWQDRVLIDHPAWRARLLPLIAGGVSVSAVGLIASRLLKPRWAFAPFLGPASLGVGLFALLLAPAAWSLMPVVAPGNPMIPVADPSLLAGTGGLAPPPMNPAEIMPLVSYLREHRQGERYLLATSNLILAALIIVQTGEPVMATRGFLGTDAILSPDKFAQMIETRQVRFALTPIPSSGVSDRGPAGYRVVAPDRWRPAHASGNSAVRNLDAVELLLRQMELYDCRPGEDHTAP